MKQAIEVTQLSKRYMISHQQATYDTLRESLSRGVKRLIDTLCMRSKRDILEELWVLQDVNFTIKAGSKVGIIGKNGAGKSTLLKILSRITYPTSGEVKIWGRVSSLLEVGTGFHPELTGRENIFLNGSILGMTHAEICSKFKEIVAFSELDKFLDTPVKRYSSGMIARLAFSVAAHLDPDILIVDEVLSVGDHSFREKCLNKMGEISEEGHTVLFVSHNMNTVMSLCDQAIYLEKGKLIACEAVESVVAQYMHQQATKLSSWTGDAGNRFCRIKRATIHEEGEAREFFYCGQKISITVEYEMVELAKDLVMGLAICTPRGLCLASSWLFPQHPEHSKAFSKGLHLLSLEIDSSIFYEGEYLAKIELKDMHGKTFSADEVVLKFSLYQAETPNSLEWETPCVVLGTKWQVEHL